MGLGVLSNNNYKIDQDRLNSWNDKTRFDRVCLGVLDSRFMRFGIYMIVQLDEVGWVYKLQVVCDIATVP